MRSFSGILTTSVAGLALLATAAYAQTPNDAVHPGQSVVVHHRMHHAGSAYDRHTYHTGSADHAAAIYNQAAPHNSPYAFNGAGGFVSEQQPLYDAAGSSVVDQSGMVCVGGRGIGYYPNPIAYGDSAATIESGGQFILDRGYRGCFAIGE
jgi:hypothetical protein